MALAALAVGVLLLHAGVTEHLADRMAEFGRVATMPPRIDVAYVRELQAAAPPLAAPAVVAPARVRPARPKAPRPAASAPGPVPDPVRAEAPPEPVAVPLPASALEPVPPVPLAIVEAPARETAAPAAVAEATPVAAPMSAASAAAETFEWPASTRLSYTLSGNYRGEVLGSAQVEWLRDGGHYQVHLDVTIGAALAPLITRRMSSDGELGLDGLRPQRYDEDTKLMFRDRRRVTMRFEPDTVVLGDGRERPRPPGVQDTASQFVQLSWLFTLHPELLRPGGTVELPLALPRNIDRWVYEVLGQETLATPFGPVEAYHLKPRRTSRPGGDLVAEMWFAPQWRYLPLRIRIEQDAETFIDLLIARRPELAAP